MSMPSVDEGDSVVTSTTTGRVMQRRKSEAPSIESQLSSSYNSAARNAESAAAIISEFDYPPVW